MMQQTTGDRAGGGGAKAAAQDPAGPKGARVYEMAKELGVTPKELIDKCRTLGLEVKNHMSSIGPDDVARVRRALDKERAENTVTERIQPTVIRRRSKGGEELPRAAAPAVRAPEVKAAPPPVEAVEPDEDEEERKPAPGRRRAVEVEAKAEAPIVHSRPRRSAGPDPIVEVKRAAEPKPEPKPEPVVEAKPEPKPEPIVEAKLEAAVEAKPEPVAKVESKAKKAAEPVVEAKPEPVVEAKPEPKPEPEVVAAEPAAPVAPERKKTQFEIELERAREASAAKQAALAAQRENAPAPVAAAPSQPGRPAVGSIIELPTPRIQITERVMPGGVRKPGFGAPVSADRGKWEQAQRGGRKIDMALNKKRLPPGKKARATVITTPAEHKRVIKMDVAISVSDLAREMGVKATEVLKKLWGMGMVGVTINQSIDLDTASLLANEFGFETQSTAFQETAVFESAPDAPEDLEHRAPVVTVMGHVDHGKTSLLDAIRHADVAAGEAGGITQHIGAYRVAAAGIGDVVFLDTPGHAAFTQMRARGAQATDIVVLVVAADDGMMPQSLEALNHAKDAKVPIIVAATKCDKPQANPDRIRQQLSEHGLLPEEWGGETIFVNVSAYTKVGIDKLLESIQLQAELLELRANPKKAAKGVVIEAKLDRNRGPMATILVQEGTLRVGDIVVSGEAMGKVRAMLNDKGSAVTEAGPSTPVEVLGLDGVPEAGDQMNVLADEKAAKTVVEHRHDARRKKELGAGAKVSLENILEKIQEGNLKELKLVLKTDVQGSAEALREALTKLSTEAVKVNVISTGVGGITESDVNLAKAGGAIIIGFHVRPAGKANSLAEQEGVDIKIYDIIYEALDDVKKAMVGLLAPVKRERALGKIEVRMVYSIPKVGTVAGCAVVEGKVTRQSLIRVIRESVQVYVGKLGSLKRFKDDAREVVQGYECGLSIDGYQDIREGDILEAYDIVEEAAQL